LIHAQQQQQQQQKQYTYTFPYNNAHNKSGGPHGVQKFFKLQKA
jgi:hypothetical protein